MTKLYVVPGGKVPDEKVESNAQAIMDAVALRAKSRALHTALYATRGRMELLHFLREEIKAWSEQ